MLVQQDLIGDFEDVPLENFDKLTLQVNLSKLAKALSRERMLPETAYSRTATTTDVYMQEIPQSVQATVKSIHSELSGKPSPRRAKAWTAD